MHRAANAERGELSDHSLAESSHHRCSLDSRGQYYTIAEKRGEYLPRSPRERIYQG